MIGFELSFLHHYMCIYSVMCSLS